MVSKLGDLTKASGSYKEMAAPVVHVGDAAVVARVDARVLTTEKVTDAT